mmetsp:Transcript_6705/g.13346  ORF Transcript_6705/g.13346 Transcript_6705/m.13346 type:complete len:97 (+) Transcript_6705:158-448(+)
MRVDTHLLPLNSKVHSSAAAEIATNRTSIYSGHDIITLAAEIRSLYHEEDLQDDFHPMISTISQKIQLLKRKPSSKNKSENYRSNFSPLLSRLSCN